MEAGTTIMAAPRKFPKARKRYIAFQVEGEASRKELEMLLRQMSQKSRMPVRLIAERYDEQEGKGLLKTGNKDALKIRELLQEPHQLNGGQITIKTMGTSGTIKTAIKKYLTKKQGRR